MSQLLCTARIIAILLALSVSQWGVANSAPSGDGINPAAHAPWKAHIFNDDLNTNYISVAHGGVHQYPIISYDPYNLKGVLRLAMPAISMTGNCGPSNTWYCKFIGQGSDDGHTSRIAVYNFRDSFKIGYIYKDSFFSRYYLISEEYSNDLAYLTTSNVEIFNSSIYDEPHRAWIMTGPPVFVFDDYGDPHMVALLQFGGGYRVVYAHEQTSGSPTDPCTNEVGTRFQCDIIYESSIPDFIFSNIRIVINNSGDPRISFFSGGNESVIYAYPNTAHANCGPGGNTWRCITIESSSADNDFYLGGSDPILLDMAIGPASPHIIMKAHNQFGHTRIWYAKFVGAGGNCGYDYLGAIQVNRWQCSTLAWDGLADPPYGNFSLKVDSLDYPVIALNWPTLANYQVGVLYPAGRTGGTPGVWEFDKADGRDIDTGYAVDLALSNDDLGLIGYGELEEYEPNLKIAYQVQDKAYLPFIKK